MVVEVVVSVSSRPHGFNGAGVVEVVVVSGCNGAAVLVGSLVGDVLRRLIRLLRLLRRLLLTLGFRVPLLRLRRLLLRLLRRNALGVGCGATLGRGGVVGDDGAVVGATVGELSGDGWSLLGHSHL